MGYADIDRRLRDGGIVILDGGTGTELQRRGVDMDPLAWCGPASLDNRAVLERIHLDYIEAGAEVITANTYASSRLMLEAAGVGDRFEEINRAAVEAAFAARSASGRDDVAVAGSLSHVLPRNNATAAPLPQSLVAELSASCAELAVLLKDAGCDLIVLEMLYHPERMEPVFAAADKTGLPVWAGFSVRIGADGRVLGHAETHDIPFAELVTILNDFEVAAAGIMHSSANATGPALEILREAYDGPLLAYPDSGYFTAPQWQFEAIIPPVELASHARAWIGQGAQIVGGCCGLSPEHIVALAPLARQAA